MRFSNEYFNSLNNFEQNLTKMGIQKVLRDHFFQN